MDQASTPTQRQNDRIKVIKDKRVTTDQNEFRVRTSKSPSNKSSNNTGQKSPRSGERSASPDIQRAKATLASALQTQQVTPNQTQQGPVKVVKMITMKDQQNNLEEQKSQENQSHVQSIRSSSQGLRVKTSSSQKQQRSVDDKKSQNSGMNQTSKSFNSKKSKKLIQSPSPIEDENKKNQQNLKEKKEERLKKLELDDKKKKEFEKQKKIEEDRQNNQEKDRLKGEQEKLAEWNKIFHERFKSMLRKVKKQESWDFLNKCSGKPKIKSEQELNAFLYHIQENFQIEKYPDWNDFLTKIDFILDVLLDLQAEKFNSQGNTSIGLSKEFYEAQIQQLQKQILYKIEDIVLNIVAQADLFYEKRKQELIEEGFDLQLLLKSTSNEERQKIEILSDFAPLSYIRYGFWINSVGKAGYRVKPIDFYTIGIQSEVPRTYMSNRLIMTAYWIGYDYLSTHYSNYLVVGGILNIQLFEYPPLPRVEREWTMKYRKDKHEDIKHLHYPNFEGQSVLNYQNVTPVKITYQLPSTLYSDEKIRVALWDNTTGWSTDLISEVKFDYEKKILFFATNKLAPIALVQSRVEDFPYKSWKIRCINKDLAVFNIQGKRVSMQFLIGPGYVQLKKQKDNFFPQLYDQSFSPGQLLSRLLQCGINILPVQNDSQIAEIEAKESEEYAIQDIIKAVNSYYIRSSNWNENSGSDKIIAYMKENLSYEQEFMEDMESDWLTIIWQNQKCGIGIARESDKSFDPMLKADNETHKNLELCLSQYNQINPQVLKCFTDVSSIQFWTTMQQMITLTRILSFTQIQRTMGTSSSLDLKTKKISPFENSSQSMSEASKEQSSNKISVDQQQQLLQQQTNQKKKVKINSPTNEKTEVTQNLHDQSKKAKPKKSLQSKATINPEALENQLKSSIKKNPTKQSQQLMLDQQQQQQQQQVLKEVNNIQSKRKESMNNFTQELQSKQIDNVLGDILYLINAYLAYLEDSSKYWGKSVIVGIEKNNGEYSRIRIYFSQDITSINLQLDNFNIFSLLNSEYLLNKFEFNFRVNKKLQNYYIFSDEQYQKTSLQQLIKQTESSPESMTILKNLLGVIIDNLLQCLNCFAAQNYYHGGVKPSNLFLSILDNKNHGIGGGKQEKNKKVKLDISLDNAVDRHNISNKDKRIQQSEDLRFFCLTVISCISLIDFTQLEDMKKSLLIIIIKENQKIKVEENIIAMLMFLLKGQDMTIELKSKDIHDIFINSYNQVGKVNAQQSTISSSDKLQLSTSQQLSHSASNGSNTHFKRKSQQGGALEQNAPLYQLFIYLIEGENSFYIYSIFTKHMIALKLFNYSGNPISVKQHLCCNEFLFVIYQDNVKPDEKDQLYLGKINLKKKILDQREKQIVEAYVQAITMIYKVNNLEEVDLEKVFQDIDLDKDGLISTKDIYAHYSKFNLSDIPFHRILVDDIQKIINCYIDNESEKMKLEEFCNLLQSIMDDKPFINYFLKPICPLLKGYIPGCIICSNTNNFFLMVGGSINKATTNKCFSVNLEDQKLNELGELSQICKKGWLGQINYQEILLLGINNEKQLFASIINFIANTIQPSSIRNNIVAKNILLTSTAINYSNGNTKKIYLNKDENYLISFDSMTKEVDIKEYKMNFKHKKKRTDIYELFKQNNINTVFIEQGFIHLSMDDEHINLHFCQVIENTSEVIQKKMPIVKYLNLYDRIKSEGKQFKKSQEQQLNKIRKIQKYHIIQMCQSLNDTTIFDVQRHSRFGHKHLKLIQRSINSSIENFDDSYQFIKFLNTATSKRLPRLSDTFIIFDNDQKIKLYWLYGTLSSDSLKNMIDYRNGQHKTGEKVSKSNNNSISFSIAEIFDLLRYLIKQLHYLKLNSFYVKDFTPSLIYYCNGNNLQEGECNPFPTIVCSIHENCFINQTSTKSEPIQQNLSYLCPVLLKAAQNNLGYENINYNYHKSNIYSLGMILLQCCLLCDDQQLLALNQNKMELIDHIYLLKQYPQFLQLILFRMLHDNEDVRADSDELLQSIYAIYVQSYFEIYFKDQVLMTLTHPQNKNALIQNPLVSSFIRTVKNSDANQNQEINQQSKQDLKQYVDNDMLRISLLCSATSQGIFFIANVANEPDIIIQHQCSINSIQKTNQEIVQLSLVIAILMQQEMSTGIITVYILYKEQQKLKYYLGKGIIKVPKEASVDEQGIYTLILEEQPIEIKQLFGQSYIRTNIIKLKDENIIIYGGQKETSFGRQETTDVFSINLQQIKEKKLLPLCRSLNYIISIKDSESQTVFLVHPDIELESESKKWLVIQIMNIEKQECVIQKVKLKNCLFQDDWSLAQLSSALILLYNQTEGFIVSLINFKSMKTNLKYSCASDKQQEWQDLLLSKCSQQQCGNKFTHYGLNEGKLVMRNIIIKQEDKFISVLLE